MDAPYNLCNKETKNCASTTQKLTRRIWEHSNSYRKEIKNIIWKEHILSF